MARGFGKIPSKTKKCTCADPSWDCADIRETINGETIITLECRNCKARWESKSRDSRRYVSLDRKAHYNNREHTVILNRNILEAADKHRVEFLKKYILRKKEEIAEKEGEIAKAQKELEFLESAPLVPEKDC